MVDGLLTGVSNAHFPAVYCVGAVRHLLPPVHYGTSSVSVSMSDDREKAEDGGVVYSWNHEDLGRKELLWEISVKAREKRRDGSRMLKETCVHLLAGGQGRYWIPTIQERQNYRHFNCTN